MKRKAFRESAPAAARYLDLARAGAFDAVLVMDEQGVVLEAGGAVTEVFGTAPEEAAGVAIEELLVPPAPRQEPSGARRGLAAVDRFPWAGRGMDTTAHHASGRELPVTVNIAELDGAGAARFVAFVRDASRLQEASERSGRAVRELNALREELKTLAVKLPLDVESERRRIARGLHDQVGNALAMARMAVGELRRRETEEQALKSLEEVEGQIGKAMEEIRSLTFELSSPVLYELGLEAALKSLGKRLADRHEIAFQFSTDDRPKPLSESRQVILYRIIEELLVNVVKHAWASQARIAVERVDDDVRITVEDDGVGFESLEGRLPGPDGGFGLFGVRQRLEHIDGKLEVEAAFPSGTRAIVSAPLEKEAE